MAIQDEIPKSRLTLTYKTEVDGELESVNLPLRMLVLGDMSLGTSKDRQMDLEDRRLRSLDGRNTDDLMKDMGMRLKFVVDNKIDPDKEDQMDIDIPIEKMNSFNPDEVAQNIPKVRGLTLLRKLLLEVESNVSNKKEFRNLLQELYSNEEAFKKMMEELKDFEGYKIPTGEGASKGDAAE